MPFGSDANDLDMVKAHCDCLEGLQSILDLAGMHISHIGLIRIPVIRAQQCII